MSTGPLCQTQRLSPNTAHTRRALSALTIRSTSKLPPSADASIFEDLLPTETRKNPMRNGPTLVILALTLALALSACGSDGPQVSEPPAVASTPAEATETADVSETAEPTIEASPTESPEQPSAEPSPESSGSATMTNMALCGDDTYDAEADVCPEPDSGFTTSELHCTGEAEIEEGGLLEVNFYYEGEDIYNITINVPDDAVGSTVPVFAFFGVGRLDIPGGTWACDIAMGGEDLANTETQVEGPTEAYSQAMSCDSEDVYTDEGTSACLEDDPQLSSGVAEGTCSAVLTGAKDATIKIVADVETDGNTEEVFLGEFESPAGVVVASGTISAAPILPDGDYTCRMLLNDEEVGSHGFSVS